MIYDWLVTSGFLLPVKSLVGWGGEDVEERMGRR